MSAKNRPYEQFGPFILFKKLEADALGDLWRAGRVDGGQLGPIMAVRRLSGGNRAELVQSAAEAGQLVPLLSGTTFAKDQTIDVANGIPFVAHEYSGGRSLRHIVDRARGGAGITPNPVPIDQAIVIAEKIALSLSTTGDLRYLGNRLAHGALIPQFVWITDEGEIRVAGQQIGKGLVASMSDSKVAAELGRYFAAEYRASAAITKTTDVYSLGAVLYLLVTGNEPPDAVTGSAFAQTIHAAKTFAGHTIPDDIRAILEKSLAVDPNARYASIGDMKQVLSSLVHGGNYSASTFNLAFYLSNLLKKELEGEALERERESKVNVAAYATVAAVAAVATAPLSSEAPAARSRVPLIAAAATVAVLAIGAGAFFMLKPKPPAPVLHASVPPQKPNVIVSQPVIAAAPQTSTAPPDPAAEKKAFEAAVEQKMQEEMMKLQADMNKKLKQEQSKNAPVQTASVISPPQPQPADDRGAAAALDQRRVTSRQEPQPPTQTVVPQAPAIQPQPQPAVSAPALTQPAVAAIREGDVVDVTELDKLPQALSEIRPYYPPLAAQQRAEATVILSALISENGDVVDVKILRGDPRFGFNDAATRAMKAVRFTPGIKDGKRVKTWRPQSISFKR